MMHYIGLDVSMKTTSICILNQEGKVVFEDSVLSEPEAIASAIKAPQLNIAKIALESGSISHWLTKELRKFDLPVICIDARCMSKILSININKTDKNDARLIAEVVRCKFFSEVHLKDDLDVDMKILINSRRTLKNSSVQMKNTIRGHLKAFGIRLGKVGNPKFASKVLECIKDKSDVVVVGLKALLAVFDKLEVEIEKIDKLIKEKGKNDKDVQLLMTIPGVGLIVAFTFKVYLGDPKRFKNSRAVGAYFGMTPRQYASGETQITGKISKQGESEVRSLLTEAASVMLYCTKSWSKLKAWGMKLRKKKGHKKTMMALGRKLATVMHRMLITQEPFKYKDEPVKKAEKAAKNVSSENLQKDEKKLVKEIFADVAAG